MHECVCVRLCVLVRAHVCEGLLLLQAGVVEMLVCVTQTHVVLCRGPGIAWWLVEESGVFFLCPDAALFVRLARTVDVRRI